METQNLSKLETLLLDIAIGKEYDTEYDGRVYRRCAHCDADLDTENHDSDCNTFEAQALLGQVWVDFQKKIKAEEKKREEAEKKERYLNSHHACEFCETRVAGYHMKLHQKSNLECMKKQANLSNFKFKKVFSGLTSCLCCHKTVRSSEFEAHYQSKKCLSHRRSDSEHAVSCLCCHATVSAEHFEDHYQSKNCVAYKF